MLTLDYSLDPGASQKSGDVDLAKASAEELRYGLFLGDVYLRDPNAGVDLSGPWGWVPVLDFALGLRAIAETLGQEKSARFEFTESEATLDFQRAGDDVEIKASYAAGMIRVPFRIFREEVRAFARRLVNELCTKNLRLAANPEIRRHLGS